MHKPVVLVVMDGVGIGDHGPGDGVYQARTPNLDRLMKTCPTTTLKAHGTAVGMPSDEDMGNSEVGHNALGCGQIYAQGARRVEESIQSGLIFRSETWQALIARCGQPGRTLHFLGLLSDGNVHSNIAHLLALLDRAWQDGVKQVRCHVLLDGRDVPATSALDYVDRLEDCLSAIRAQGGDYQIASGGGRMQITMDRYEADWPMVERGWQTHVLGQGRQFASAREAITTLRQEQPEVIDQDLPPFVIAREGQPVGPVENGDGVVLYNFRGDRALEISHAFDDEQFDHFDRGGVTDVLYAGMLQYDGDLKLPKRYLVQPPDIQNTLSELLAAHGLTSYALSETQKYGHVTYFWNGNRSSRVDEALETWQELPSDTIPFDQAPDMKAREITQALVAAMESGKYQFLRCNYPNGDMVGHTGVFPAVLQAMETVDSCIGQVCQAARDLGYTLLITADHGNADQMLDTDKKGNVSVRTAHSLNPVPFILVDPDLPEARLRSGGLANVAATIAQLLELPVPQSWEPSLLEQER